VQVFTFLLTRSRAGRDGQPCDVLGAEALQQAMVASQEGNLPHAWITPLGLMQEEHWQTLAAVWRDAAGCAPALTPPQRAPDR
jgi:hypothetical protein